MTIEQFENNVHEWADERGIFREATKASQHKKTLEEVDELYFAILNPDKFSAKDAIGDIIVTLAIQAKMWNLSLMECCDAAWNEIKDRTGKMENGIFVKDAVQNGDN